MNYSSPMHGGERVGVEVAGVPGRLARKHERRRDLLVAAGVSALAFGLRFHTALQPLETQDERNWMRRTVRFSEALHNRDFENASALPEGHTEATLTMPGVTTMWVGTIARWIWGCGKQLGLWPGVDDPAYGGGWAFHTTRSGLQIAQAAMAATTAVLVGVLAFVVIRWVGSRTAGAITGVLVATEPFMVAHGAVLHTDELMTLCGVIALVLSALALGLPSTTSWAGKKRVVVLAGAFAGAAVLTKISALMFLIGAALLFGWAKLAAARRVDGRANGTDGGVGGLVHRVRPVCIAGLWWCAGFVLMVTLAYPALWFRPGDELESIHRTTTLAGEGHIQYFLGESTSSPAVTYYLVATPIRSTPWLLVGAVGALVALGWRRHTQGYGLTLALMAMPVLVILSTASKKFDRYGLALLVFGILAISVVSARPVGILRDRFAERVSRLRLRHVLVCGAGAMALYSFSVSPSGLAYYNPLLGGSSTAEDALLIGWGEGREEIGKLIEDHAGSCDDITVSGYPNGASFYACGERPDSGEEATYQIVAAQTRQRNSDWYRTLTADRDLVAVVRVRGLDYHEVFGPSPSP